MPRSHLDNAARRLDAEANIECLAIFCMIIVTLAGALEDSTEHTGREVARGRVE